MNPIQNKRGAWWSGLFWAAAFSSLSAFPIASTAAESAGGRWALLVGIDDYVRARKLDYCGADMQALSQTLIAAGFPKEHVYLLHDKAEETKNRPMKTNIEDHLRVILGLVGRDDLVIVGFSGHGVHLEGKSYLCPAEADLDNPGTLIGLDEVYERLEKCPASLKLFLVDACRNDPRPGERSLAPTAESRQFAQSLERPPQGILTLTSCAPGEKAREEKEFGHGVFMHYVLEGIGGPADVNHNGWVSMLELYLYANDKTKTYVARKYVDSQRPSLKGHTEDDFDLVRLPERVIPQPPKPSGLPREVTNSIGMKLVLVPAGEFTMGSPESEEDHVSDESPQHRVRITRPFYLGAYEVTQSEYEAVMGDNPSQFKGARHPVEMVSWNDAVEFFRRLSEKEGKTYRLPTEAEWEYACRAGTTTPFSFGSVLNGDQANCDGNYPYGTETKGPYKKWTTEVGSYRPNAFGLYDMHGNVWEWCADWYDSGYYGTSSANDPVGPSSGATRVLRGGSWISWPYINRSAYRYRDSPDGRNFNIGFRAARTP